MVHSRRVCVEDTAAGQRTVGRWDRMHRARGAGRPASTSGMLCRWLLPSPARRLRRVVSNPLRRYLDYKFSVLETRLDGLAYTAAAGGHPLSLVDVSDHNTGMTPPTFSHVVSQVVSAAQFWDESFERLRALVFPGAIELATGEVGGKGLHRKVWEYVYVLKAAEQPGLLAPGRAALGFGVGTEPLPAVLARHGVRVLATDQDRSGDTAGTWAETGQHMSDLSALSNPAIVSDARLRELVDLKHVDMTAVPDDLGAFDLIWSCCALEHLGSPEAGLEFVRQTLPLLEPAASPFTRPSSSCTNR